MVRQSEVSRRSENFESVREKGVKGSQKVFRIIHVCFCAYGIVISWAEDLEFLIAVINVLKNVASSFITPRGAQNGTEGRRSIF